MKSVFGTMFVVAMLMLAVPAFAEEFNIEPFIGKPVSGGATCVSLADAQKLATAAIASNEQDVRLLFLDGKCEMFKHYVPKWIVERLERDLMILEVMGGGDFIMPKWVVATPTMLRPLMKTEELHEVESPSVIVPPDSAKPPGEIPRGHWQ